MEIGAKETSVLNLMAKINIIIFGYYHIIEQCQ
jgi:hypothetical protein